MFLTEKDRRAVLEAAHGIQGDPEELVRQAFEAILHGQADEVAYSVTEAAGVQWLTPEIWFKEKMQVNAEQARALLTQAKKDGTTETPIPEDDAKAISEAEELVEMAQTAWDQLVRGPEVEVLLRMSADFQNGGPPEKEEQPKQEAPPETPETQPEETKAEADPESDVTRGETEPQAEGGGDDLSQVEPWENYDKEKVSDIKAGINAAVREYSDDDLLSLMSNVWQYEAAHKNRETVLKHLEEVAARLQDGGDIPEDPPDASNDAPMDDDETIAAAEEEVASTEQDQTGQVEAEEVVQEEPAKEEAEEPPKDETPPEDQQQDEPPKEKPKRRMEKKQEQGGGDGEDSDYENLMKQVEEELERDRLHKPQHPEEDIPDLPWDWTKMSDKDLQRFHGIYSSAAYYKSYLVSRDERMALHCKAAADELHNAIMVALDKYDENGKEKKVALVEAEIESDENVIKWRRRQRKHETFAASHRNEMNSMSKIVEALSRTESMRQQEWERSGGKMGRKG